MKRKFSDVMLLLTLLTGLMLNSGCEKKTIEDQGILAGKISIGPLCPVESDPPQPECLPTAETYKAYPVDVWTADGKVKICRLDPSLEGDYTAELDPGKYKIVLADVNQGPGGSNLPVEVTIFPDKITSLDISIDTGIR